MSLESRHAKDATRLIVRAGGVAISAPSMRELPLDDNPEAFEFAEALLADAFDVLVFMTGVGTRYLFEAMATRHDLGALTAAAAKPLAVARGPKPVAALKELGIPVDLTVAEPNTWKELLEALDQSPTNLDGAKIAIQQYGVSNPALVEALKQRGAIVTEVPVYRWALPEDLGPLQDAIDQILARTADVLLFTSSKQADHLLQVVGESGREAEFRQALQEIVVCSVGPLCTETLTNLGLPVDVEPAHPKLGTLIKTASEQAIHLILKKRSEVRAEAAPSVQVSTSPERAADRRDGAFLRACRREPTPYTPVWLMRQAGRYMQEYRELRAQHSFMELCKAPELAAEVAVTAVDRIGADAAILFSDILLILEPMGLGLEYVQGDGPSISGVVRNRADVDRLHEVDPAKSLGFVFDSVRQTRAALRPELPLIGFSGAPFTLASYILEGGGSKNYIATKTLMYQDPGAWNALMERIARAVSAYLRGQVEAGADAVQLFDSWVGCLSPDDYRRYVLPHTQAALAGLPKDLPIILFGTDTATLLDLQASAGPTVIGVDHRTPLGATMDRFPNFAVQGNLDPVLLFSNPERIREGVRAVIDDANGRPGHIFNLGHGILPATPVENVIALVDAVHEFSRRNAT